MVLWCNSHAVFSFLFKKLTSMFLGAVHVGLCKYVPWDWYIILGHAYCIFYISTVMLPTTSYKIPCCGFSTFPAVLLSPLGTCILNFNKLPGWLYQCILLPVVHEYSTWSYALNIRNLSIFTIGKYTK